MSKASQRSGSLSVQNARRYAARVGTAVLMSAAVVTLAACSPSLKLEGHEVDSKAPWLQQIDDQWRNDLGRGTASTGEKSGCWLARDDSGEFDRVAFCGPVRHLEKPDAGVWDAYSFDATVSDNKSLSVENIGLKEMGAKFPDNRKAYRPSGGDLPKNADELAAPKAPPLPSGYVKRLSSENTIELKDRAAPKNGKIIGPNLELTVTDVGRVDTVGGESQGMMGPADGEELRAIVLTVKSDGTSSTSSSTINTTPVFSIQTPKGRKTIDLTDETFGGRALPDGPITILAGVPKGQDAQLVVGIAGVDQTVSLRTGDRTSTVAAGYYRSSTTVALNKQFLTTQITNGNFGVRHGVTFAKADIVPFIPTSGWAKPGKSWLQLSCTNVDMDKTADYRYNDPVIDPAKSITFTDDKGAKIPYTGKDLPCAIQDEYMTDQTLTLEIPDSAKSIRVNYAPTGTFSANKYGQKQPKTQFDFLGTSEVNPKKGSFAFKPLVFTIAIPQ
ncbi:hypothetical protein ACFV9C_44660 [Kribbella sp. NPDC059898]|uniref:hypothetical protein n=1 Tax=Kribbella sp. NPDC059898 TaxID=3346995 RepID=UPI00364DA1D5